MKQLLFILAFTIPTFLFSQFNFSAETVISDNSTGYGRPRMAITANDIPVIIWYKEGNDHSLMMSRGNGDGTFSAPIEIVDHDLEPTGFIGPEIAAKGDTVYITFICGIANDAIMIKKSFDGGITFSDTIRVSPNNNAYKFAMPNIAVKENGNPIVSYMKCLSNYTNWEQMVRVSFDLGLSFSVETDASAIAPGEPCDCCKSTIVTQGNNIFLLFRNDNNNVRNMYISKSTDGGISFNSYQDLDDLDWVINSCPTSSGNGVINGDSIMVVRRNAGSGVHQLYVSNVNSTDLQKSYFKELDPIGSGLQDKAEIAGKDNIYGMVWHDNRSGNNSCYFSYSTDGINNCSASIEMSDSTANGHKMFPDIEYSNGKFYFVYKYSSGYSIIYKELDLSTLNSVQPIINSDKKLIKIIDYLGRETKNIYLPHIKIYSDNSKEKRLIIE